MKNRIICLFLTAFFLISCKEKNAAPIDSAQNSSGNIEKIDENKNKENRKENKIEQTEKIAEVPQKNQDEKVESKIEPKVEPKVEEKYEPWSILDIALKSVEPSVFIAQKNNIDRQHNVYDNGRMYFAGFSKDGHIAFFSDESREGKGGTSSVFFIQDLITDEIKEQITMSGDSFDAAALVKNRFKEIDALIAKYKIIRAEVEFLPLPYSDGNRTINADVKISDTGKLIHDMFRIIDYDCIVSSSSGVKKTVCSKKDAVVENVFVCGYVKNPFENRLALVVAELVYGFEGYDVLYSISGCLVE